MKNLHWCPNMFGSIKCVIYPCPAIGTVKFSWLLTCNNDSYVSLLSVLQHGDYVLTLDTVKRMSRNGGRPHSLLMKCPVALGVPSQELIQCDPEFIQVGDQQMMDITEFFFGYFTFIYFLYVCR